MHSFHHHRPSALLLIDLILIAISPIDRKDDVDADEQEEEEEENS